MVLTTNLKNEIMKMYFIVLTVLALTACSTPEEVVVEQIEEVVVVEDVAQKLVGKVRVGDKCVLYLETYEEGQLVTMYPVNLEENLKYNGAKISFTYTLSRAKQPENCQVDKVVALDNVTLMR